MPIVNAGIFESLNLFINFLSVIDDIRWKQGIISLNIGDCSGWSGGFRLPVGNMFSPVGQKLLRHFPYRPRNAIVMKGKHLCKSMRGVRNNGDMTVSYFTGCFKEDTQLRNEFFNMIHMNGRHF